LAIRIEKILIQEKVLDEPLTRRILKNCPKIPHTVVGEEIAEDFFHPISLRQGKRVLFLTEHKGDQVRPCPGTLPPYLCCRYTVINSVLQCPMECSYCILQTYLDRPVVTLHVNLFDMFQNVQQLVANEPCRFFRFGTGELSDSLALDSITGLSRDFTDFFSTQRNTILELKTKTNCIQNLLSCKTGNTVVSWSLNPQKLVEGEERGSASIEERLKAARQCQDRGFLLGFHFDPILWVDPWESLYRELIQQLFSHVDGSRIAWVSLGSLRFPPALKEIVQKRFPKNRIVCEEMIRGQDGKMRYPRPLRTGMYQKVFGWIKEEAPDLFVYFCMESPAVWDRVMGNHPESNEELDFWFAQSLWQRFPELDMDEPRREVYIPD